MDYNRAVATVRRLIAASGRVVTFQRLSSTAADSSKPWKGPSSPTVADSASAPAAFVPAAGNDLGKAFVSEELLKQCEQVCIAAPIDAFDLEGTSDILDAGQRWGVQWIHVLRPGATAVLFVFGVKR